MLVKMIRLNCIKFNRPGAEATVRRNDRAKPVPLDQVVADLAENIKQTKGLIHPILVRKDRKGRFVLIAGRTRLLAYRLLKKQEPANPRWRAIPCHIYTDQDVKDVMLGVSENSHRSDPITSAEFTQGIQTLMPSEQLAFIADVKQNAEKEARERKQRGKAAGPSKGKTAAKLAKLLNRSPAWVERATAIIKAAEEDPKHFGPFKQQMDDRGRVYCAYQRMLDMKRTLVIKAEAVTRHPKEKSFITGDCLKLMREMPDGSWDNIVTDSPFGLGKTFHGWREPGTTPGSFWRWFEPHFMEMWRVVRPGGLLAMFLAWEYRHLFPTWFAPYGYTIYNELYVHKKCVDPRKNNRNQQKTAANGTSYCPLLLAIDPVVMLWKPGARQILDPTWKGRNRQNWIEADMARQDPIGKIAPFAKPVKLMEDIIFRWTVEGTSILDPFCGSGATCIAADRLGHPWMGIDRATQACKLASRRLKWHREESAMLDNNDWSTEQEFWDELNKVFQFTVDAAASNANAKLPKFWTKQQDALKQDWRREKVWLNPPFEHGKIEPFLQKAKNADLCCAIVPATCLTTNYFKRVRPDYIALPDRRIHFDPPTGPRQKTQHALTGFPLLIYGGLTEEQIMALESMRLTVFSGIPKGLVRE